MVSAPAVLATQRLRLRWFAPGDADDVVALLNDPDWLLHIGDRGVRTADDARRFVDDRLVAGYWRHGFGMWALERRDSGAFVGMCGLVSRDGLPGIDLGYALLPAHRGNGFVREAGAACLEFAARALGEASVYAIVSPHNARSIAVLAALGMRRAGVVQLSGDPGPIELFEWRNPAPSPGDDRAHIDALTARFFAAFANRGAPSRVLTLPHFFTPGAAVTVPDGDRAKVVDVRAFVEPRAELLLGGRLCDFEEGETAQQTELHSTFAVRTLRYRKQGVLDGVPFAGAGTKVLQFARGERGWRIASLAWRDDP